LFDEGKTGVTSEQLAADFNAKEWSKKIPGLLKAAGDTVDGKKPELNAGSIVDDAATGAMTALTTGGDIKHGIWFSVKHSLFNFIKNIPFVGNLLGQIKTYFGAMFSDKKLGWSEAGQVYRDNQPKNRLNETLGQYVDSKQLLELYDEAAKEVRTKPLVTTTPRPAGTPVTDPAAPDGMIVPPPGNTPGTPPRPLATPAAGASPP
jgi:hypothetical protein